MNLIIPEDERTRTTAIRIEQSMGDIQRAYYEFVEDYLQPNNVSSRDYKKAHIFREHLLEFLKKNNINPTR